MSPIKMYISLLAVILFVRIGAAQELSDLVRINGLTSISEAKARGWLEAQLELTQRNGISLARADDLAFFLESELLDRGYDDAIVDWKLTGNHIELNVIEGRTQNIVGLSITGNQELSTEAIEELLLTTTRDRLRLKAKDTTPYVRNDIAKGKAQVLELYLLLGYVDATVEITGGHNLKVTISEGVRHLIGDISIANSASEEFVDAFKEIKESISGKPLSPASLSRLQTQIRDAAVNMGYFHTKVDILQESTIILDSGDKSVDLVVQTNWGELVKIDQFEIEGNDKVATKFFKKQLAGIVGKPYSPKETNRTIEALLKTGAFATIRTELVESADGSNTLKVYVEESKSRSLGVYGGFATYEGPLVGIEFQDRNLFGSARKIDANIELSGRGLRGEIQYTDPWFLWTNYELRASLFAFNREEEGYERFTTGGR